MDLIHMDNLTIESVKRDDKLKKDINVLVVTDHFARYAQVFVMPSQTTKVVARHCGTNILFPMGIL